MHSLRVDTSEWISGALLIGDAGLGVLGSDIPSSGDNGAGYAYNDLSLPADADKEICGRITTWPSAGTLFAYEDTSFDFSGAPDGVYTFEYQLYVDGVAAGDPATVTLQVGAVTHAATGSLSAGSAQLVGDALRLRAHAVTGALSVAGAEIAGGAEVASGVVVHEASGTIIAGSGSVSGESARIGEVIHAAHGDLLGGNAQITGAALRARLHSVEGAIAASGASLTGASTRLSGEMTLTPADIAAIADAVWEHILAININNYRPGLTLAQFLALKD